MFAPVTDLVWRGPRPQGSTDFASVRASFKSVVSLEGMAEDQKEMVELAPVPVISCPIVFSEIYFTGITESRLNAILGEIAAAPKPVLVHCQHGEDRTGLIIAAYRVRVCLWTKDAAMKEALAYGYRNWLNFGINKTWANFTE
jgi:tyrosine-protein phosphatase SIW14